MRKKKPIMLDLFGEKSEEICPVINKGRQKLSAAQSEFNRLNKKIVALRDDIRELPEREQIIKTFFDEQAASLFDEERDLTLRLLERLDAAYEGGMKLTKKEKNILPELLLKEMEYVDDFNLSEEQQQRVDELSDKYQDIASGMTREEREKEAVEAAMAFCSMMGVKPNAKMKKAKTTAEFEEALEDHLMKEWEKKMEKAEDRGTKKASSGFKEKKLSKRELKQKLQEEQTMKSIRGIYIELVKALHPDKELDEKMRQLKEERMKQLTKAYQAKDLASLLRMQIEWLEESSVSPETQTDDVLKRYNKLLRSQLQRLEEEYELMCKAPFPGVLGTYGGFRIYRVKDLKKKLSDMLDVHINELDKIKEYVELASINAGLKAILKEFALKRKEEDDFADFLDFFMK
ncbi:MAG: J domain-containing protein [Parabacteroides sp.]|nr:J domain-containing protein [Parabacteroides sp.]